jgi:hypothetical protein
MIEIGKLDEVSRDQRYLAFPNVDFKFQNTGSATAFLWRFAISVLSSEVDTTPVLSFRYVEADGALRVGAYNRGWGTANRCEVTLASDVLGLVYSLDEMRSCESIPDGDSKTTVLVLPPKDLSIESFDLVKERARSVESSNRDYRDRYYWDDDEPNIEIGEAVPVGALTVNWKCVDDSRNAHEGSDSVSEPDFGALFLTRVGLRFRRASPPCGAAMGPGPAYVALIDPTKRSQECVYSISRQIPPGGVERFSIVIGSPMSCRLVLRFRFFVDKSDVVESERFDVHVWNPRGSGWQYRYRDGAELAVSAGELASFPFVPKPSGRRGR